LANPFLGLEPRSALRDPATILHDGVYHCFYTVVEQHEGNYQLFVDVSTSRDLGLWSKPRRLTQPGLNYSSPGNIIRLANKWFLCLQSYPTKLGNAYGSDDSRLWLMESEDLVSWDEPYLLEPRGCRAKWCKSKRQIDPYLVEHEGKFWCFYKSDGKLGLLVSSDLKEWEEASPDAPVLDGAQTPDSSTVENACAVRDGDEWVLFFAPCRDGRGIGVARSTDLIHWREVRYLDFPALPWAPGGPTAAMVLDTRVETGCWTMFFHGDRHPPHGAALGWAWSDDLETWHCPE